MTIGLLVGISIWIRPEGLTLAGPALLAAFLITPARISRFEAAARFLIGMAIPFVPYLILNNHLSGSWWPNTFFAKQAEYAVYQQVPFFRRLLREAGLLLIGPGVLLLPGFVIYTAKAFYQKDWVSLAWVTWGGGFILIYAVRLPVLYQHGRYIIPVMPVYFLLSLAGMIYMVRWKSPNLSTRVLWKVWVVSLTLVTLAFWGIGANAYARDVAVIESEMVTTAEWISTNTEPDALIAAHDIGALGYFGNRRILDLAGLVSPEVIPFIRDEIWLATWMDVNDVDFLMTFPSWYPDLVKLGESVFISKGRFSPSQGGENMEVYRWH